MHSWTWFDDPNDPNDSRVTFHYNGDYSGDVLLLARVGQYEAEISVPYQALRDFVLRALASEEISTIEQASYDELADRYKPRKGTK
jgi:hypothetical protein